MAKTDEKIRINRTPVLTLWAAVVAERLGFDRETALTLGQAVAGLSAYAKGVSLGIIEPSPDLVRDRGERLGEGEQLHVDLLGRAVPVARTPDGLRAVSKGNSGVAAARNRQHIQASTRSGDRACPPASTWRCDHAYAMPLQLALQVHPEPQGGRGADGSRRAGTSPRQPC